MSIDLNCGNLVIFWIIWQRSKCDESLSVITVYFLFWTCSLCPKTNRVLIYRLTGERAAQNNIKKMQF